MSARAAWDSRVAWILGVLGPVGELVILLWRGPPPLGVLGGWFGLAGGGGGGGAGKACWFLSLICGELLFTVWGDFVSQIGSGSTE